MATEQQVRNAIGLIRQDRTDEEIERLTGIELSALIELRAFRASAPRGDPQVRVVWLNRRAEPRRPT